MIGKKKLAYVFYDAEGKRNFFLIYFTQSAGLESVLSIGNRNDYKKGIKKHSLQVKSNTKSTLRTCIKIYIKLCTWAESCFVTWPFKNKPMELVPALRFTTLQILYKNYSKKLYCNYRNSWCKIPFTAKLLTFTTMKMS